MTIGTPVTLGEHNQAASSTNALTTGADSPVGSLILVEVAIGSASISLSSVTDSAGNSYTVADDTAGSATQLGFAYCIATVDLPIGGTITAHLSGSTASAIGACSVSGIAASPLDSQNHTASGTATSAASVSTGTLAQASEILFGLLTTNGNDGGYTPGGSWTTVFTVGGTPTLHLAYQIVSSTASVAWAPTWINSIAYISDVVSFIGASLASRQQSMALLGVG